MLRRFPCHQQNILTRHQCAIATNTMKQCKSLPFSFCTSLSSSSSSLFKPTRPSLYINQTEFGSTLDHNLGIDVFGEGKSSNNSSNNTNNNDPLLSSSRASYQNSVHVIATIGPASASEEKIKQMIEGGMNICRLNFSHGTHEYHQNTIDMVRGVIDKHFKNKQCHVAIALDTKGPEIRLGKFDPTLVENTAAVRFEVGQKVKVTNDMQFHDKMSTELLFIDYPNLHAGGTAAAGGKSNSTSKNQKLSRILIADGVLELKVVSPFSSPDDNTTKSNNNKSSSSHHNRHFLYCEVVSEATIGSKSNVNLPGIATDLPAISEKDMKDLEFAAKMDIDMVFASFTRSAFHIKMIGELLRSNKCSASIVAKIENHEGVQNINEILEADACSGVMCARGDLGVEIPPERVFLAQKKIVSSCNLAGKPAIVATQLLETMIKSPRPTRAEIADVANAVLDGCDVTMLSGETAKGNHPVKAVETLKKIGQTAFNYIRHQKHLAQMISHNQTTTAINSTAAAAVLLSHQNNAKCIITVTKSGRSVHELRKYSPAAPIIAVCIDAKRARKLNLVRGVIPLVFQDVPYEQFDDQIASAIDFFVKTPELSSWIGLELKQGDVVVISCTDSYHNDKVHAIEEKKKDNTNNTNNNTNNKQEQEGHHHEPSRSGYETFVKILKI